MDERKYSHVLHARIGEFVLPPIEDGLVLGRRSPIGHVAVGKALSLLTTTPYEHVTVEDDVIGDVLVRSAILRKIPASVLIDFVLHEIKPLMGAEEILHLNLEVEISIESKGR